MKHVQTAAFGLPEYEPRRNKGYRPRISPEQLRRLKEEKQRIDKPMTQIVADALELYFENIERG
jgi:predicted DNA-binding protein